MIVIIIITTTITITTITTIIATIIIIIVHKTHSNPPHTSAGNHPPKLPHTVKGLRLKHRLRPHQRLAVDAALGVQLAQRRSGHWAPPCVLPGGHSSAWRQQTQSTIEYIEQHAHDDG